MPFDPSQLRSKVTQLMGPIRSKARKKAIITISKKHNITRQAAQFRQSLAIAKSK